MDWAPGGAQTVHETVTVSLSYDSANHFAYTNFAINPDTLFHATRLAAWQVLFEQYASIDCSARFIPALGRGSSGVIVGYLDRDSTDATQPSIAKALVEKEKVVGQINDGFVLNWQPRMRYEVQEKSLDPGSDARTRMHFVTGKIIAYDVTEAPDTTVLGQIILDYRIRVWGSTALVD
jgi:hypothetical protein